MDHITTTAAGKMWAKLDVTEKDKRIEEIEVKLRAAEAGAWSTTTAMPPLWPLDLC